ncbi:HupE/UreJ family protein [Psychroserpens mesophilus]|uniref:HupE/UreJ family protein n=1 Tax=Psychroserpens mesophilus TaxID=325473 RepID=UPI003D64AC90
MIDNFISNLQDGIYHVLHINAYEHILFLIVLILPYLFKDWKRILLLITVFTVGHCLSLSLVTYNIISVDLKVISFLISFIILIVALFNIFTAGKKVLHTKIGVLFFITLFFGLVHGLGFADNLNALTTASENKLLAILEIALGLEIGQLIVAFIIVFLSFLCQTLFRFSKRDWIMVISAIVLGSLIPILINSSIFS